MKNLVIFTLSSESNRWSVGASICWSELGLNNSPARIIMLPSLTQYELMVASTGKSAVGRNKMVKLDINKMVLSCINLPPDHSDMDACCHCRGRERQACNV